LAQKTKNVIKKANQTIAPIKTNVSIVMMLRLITSYGKLFFVRLSFCLGLPAQALPNGGEGLLLEW